MITIVLVGAVTALAMFAVLMKLFAGEPKEMEKMEKGDIIKQLLALSELEGRSAKTATARPDAPKSAPPKSAAPQPAPPKLPVKAAEGKAAAKAKSAGVGS